MLVAGAFRLEAYAVASGEKIWWVRGLTWQIKPTPVMDEDTIYVQNWAGNVDLGKQEDVPPLAEILKTHDKDGDGGLAPDEAPDPKMTKSWEGFDLDRDGVMGARELGIPSHEAGGRERRAGDSSRGQGRYDRGGFSVASL